MSAIAREVPFRRAEVQTTRRWIARVRAWLRDQPAAEPTLFQGVDEIVRDAAVRRAEALRR